MRIDKLKEVQSKAVEAWPGVGTIVLATGVGKTITSFKALYSKVPQGSTVWFLAETTVREITLQQEFEEFHKLTGMRVDSDYSFEFKTYQSKPSGKVTCLIMDEIHDALTPKYSLVFENCEYDYLIGLTATVPANLMVDDIVTKGELLAKYCPVVFEYPLEKAVEDGILSPYETTVIRHRLDNANKVLQGGSKAKPFMTTEEAQYAYLSKMQRNFAVNEHYRKICMQNMCSLLYSLPSKHTVVKELLEWIPGKTVMFANSIPFLQKHVKTVTGEQSEKESGAIISDFNSGNINAIGSFKKLRQGITLNGVDHGIIASYYSKTYIAVQQLGRLVRYSEGKLAKLFIIVTEGTWEEKWFTEIQSELDLNIVATISSSGCTKKTLDRLYSESSLQT